MRKLTSIKNVCTFIFAFFCASNLSAQTEGTIKVQSNERIKLLVAKKRTYNKNLKTVKGFKIQLFYGSEQGAIKVREEFNSVFPDIRSELKFISPDWKVWAGSFKTKLEADRTLAEITEGFPSAIRIVTQIKL
jgi:hypothetical protein